MHFKPEGQNRLMAHPGNRSRFRIRRPRFLQPSASVVIGSEPALVPRDHAPVAALSQGTSSEPRWGKPDSFTFCMWRRSTISQFPIDMSGEIRVPVVGRIQVAGLTTAQVETE